MYAKGCGWLEVFFFNILHVHIHIHINILSYILEWIKKGLFSKWWW